MLSNLSAMDATSSTHAQQRTPDAIEEYVSFLTHKYTDDERLQYVKKCRERMCSLLYGQVHQQHQSNRNIVNRQTKNRIENVKEYSSFWVQHPLPVKDAFANEFLMQHITLLHIFSLPFEELEQCTAESLQLRYHFLTAVDTYLTKNPHHIQQAWIGVFQLSRLVFVHNVENAMTFWSNTIKNKEKQNTTKSVDKR